LLWLYHLVKLDLYLRLGMPITLTNSKDPVWSWLQTLASDSESAGYLLDIMSPTSPKKRLRYDEEDVEEAEDGRYAEEGTTPRGPTRSMANTVPLRLCPPATALMMNYGSRDTDDLFTQQSTQTPLRKNTGSSTSGQTPSLTSDDSTGGTSRRSKSPVKKVAHLELLSKPVEYRAMVDKKQLPHELQELLRVIYGHDSDQAIYPAVIRDEIATALSARSPPLDHTFYSTGEEQDPGQARAQLQRLKNIMGAALECVYWTRSEPAWNLLVHWPILNEALSSVACVEPELITTAQILPAFLPDMSDFKTTSQAKLVDLALLYRPPNSSSDTDSLTNLFRSLPASTATLNQSDYGPLRKFPAPVAIETKTAGGDIEEAKVQLGVWTAAWFKRMADLDRQSKSKRQRMKTSPRSLGVPLLLIEGHRWSLYVACENDADIVSPSPFHHFPLSILCRSYIYHL
jgi:hypothetical protein